MAVRAGNCPGSRTTTQKSAPTRSSVPVGRVDATQSQALLVRVPAALAVTAVTAATTVGSVVAALARDLQKSLKTEASSADQSVLQVAQDACRVRCGVAVVVAAPRGKIAVAEVARGADSASQSPGSLVAAASEELPRHSDRRACPYTGWTAQADADREDRTRALAGVHERSGTLVLEIQQMYGPESLLACAVSAEPSYQVLGAQPASGIPKPVESLRQESSAS